MTARVDISARIADLLTPDTPEELERRRAHLFGLLLIATVSIAKYVTGLTGGSAQYTLHAAAIRLTAIAGGIAPACVATLAAILLTAGGPAQTGAAGPVAF